MSATNTNIMKLPEPERLGLTSFLDLLPQREQLPAQGSEDFDAFRVQILRSLMPETPYECLLGDNLATLEWELLQHRRMRDRCLRNEVRERIVNAFVAFKTAAHEDELDKEFDDWIEAGNAEEDFVERPFEKDAAKRAGEAVAGRAFDPDPKVALDAENEIAALGLDLLSVLANVSAASSSTSSYHHRKILELEKRAREVKRDLDGLRALRPGQLIEMIE